MNLLDYVIIIAMGYLIIKGVLRGFLREISSLAGIILGIWLGNMYQPQLTIYLKNYLPSSQYLPLISFAAIFIAVVLLCNLIGWVLKLLLKKIMLGWLDRTLGSCLAFAKGVLIIYLFIVMLTFFLPGKTPLIAGSKLAPWIVRSYQVMSSLISPDHYQNLKRKIVGTQEEISKAVSEKVNEITETP